MKNYIIVDIDGTIADATHRLHYIHDQGPGKKDWNAFFNECVHDTPHQDVIDLVRLCSVAHNHEVLYVSGRSDQVRLETRAWLVRHGLPFGRLHMRKQGDHRPDYQVKSEILDQIGLKPENVWFVLDDRDQVVDMWRNRGFRVLQVADGNF